MATPPLTALRRWVGRRPFDAWFLAGALLSEVLFAWLGQGGFPLAARSGAREHYYTVAALALLHGHLWVPRSALTFECFMVRNRCYGYFGIAPSLLRLPLVALQGAGAQNNITEFVFFNLGFLVAAAGAWWISRQLVALWAPGAGRRANAVMGFCAAIAGAGATPLLFLVTRPLVYEEAILWGAAFAAVALGAAISLWLHPRRATLVVLLLADLLGVLSRPTSGASGLLATVVLGLWYLRSARRRKPVPGVLKPAVWGLCLVVGAGLAAVSSSAVAYAKFHSPSPPYKDQLLLAGDPVRIATFEHFAGLNAAVLPTKLWSTLRPNSLKLLRATPHVALGEFHAPLIWPAKRTDVVWEPTASVSDVLPFSVAVAIAGVAFLGADLLRWRKARGPDPALAVSVTVLASALAALVVGLMFVGQTYRYLGDWVPVFVVADAIGMACFVTRFRARRRRFAVLTVVALLLLAGQVFIQGGLAVENGLWTGGFDRPHCSGALNPYGVVGKFFCPASLFHGRNG